MVNQIMTRNLDVPEIRKFEAMLRWATNKSKLKPDPEQEFKHIMDRLKKDIDLMKIAPQDLIRVRNTNIFSQVSDSQSIIKRPEFWGSNSRRDSPLTKQPPELFDAYSNEILS